MRRLRLLAPLLLLAAAPAQPQAHPALWKLSDADTTIYLFGTIHILPAGTVWMDPPIKRAVESAQSLTLEAVLDQDPGQVATVLMKIGTAKGLPSLAERVPPAKRAPLAAMVKASGLPSTFLDGMKSWAAAIMLTGPALQQIGVDAATSPGVNRNSPPCSARPKSRSRGLKPPRSSSAISTDCPKARSAPSWSRRSTIPPRPRPISSR